MLFAQTFMQSRKANRQSKVGVVNSVFSFAAYKQFHQQESDSNEAHSTFSGGFLS